MGLGFSKRTGGGPSVLVLPALEKRDKKKSRKKSVLDLGLVGSSKVNQTYVEVRQFFFECPSFFSDYVRSLEWCAVQRQHRVPV
jgi:hypothetical protein